jgi:hypothetical protein
MKKIRTISRGSHGVALQFTGKKSSSEIEYINGVFNLDSPLKIQNQIIYILLDDDAWVGTETELYLESNVFRDLGDVGVSTTVTVTLDSVTGSILPQYYFKFKYSTGGSFVYTSITAAPDNPDLEDGVYYEGSIIRGVLIYKEIA